MDKVLTLIVNPLENKLSADRLNSFFKLLKHHGCDVAQPEWLSQEEAVDLPFSGDIDGSLIVNLALGIEADFAVQNSKTRRKKMLIADMDSTMIGQECIDELADFAGLKEHVSAITEAAMRGELDFDEAIKERVGLLKGMSTDVLEKCYKERITLMPGAKALVQTMAASGAITSLVSGGFTFFTSRIASRLGFSMNRANVLLEENGSLTGKVQMPICNSSTKLETLLELKKDYKFKTDDIMAVGDGANDIPMIHAAGFGIAYHAKPKAQSAADVSINHTDLSALLFMQGYKRDDFVAE